MYGLEQCYTIIEKSLTTCVYRKNASTFGAKVSLLFLEITHLSAKSFYNFVFLGKNFMDSVQLLQNSGQYLGKV